MRQVVRIASRVIAAGTAESAMWIVSGTVLRSGPAIIITGVAATPNRVALRWPRYSVWPGKRKPAS